MTFKQSVVSAIPAPLKKKLLGSKGIYTRSKKAATALQHLTHQKVLGRQENHLILCGFSRSGTTMAYNMMRHSVEGSDVMTMPRELSALRSKGFFCENIITKRPLDAMIFEEIEKEIGGFRNLRYVALIRDPRDSLSSFHKNVPNQFFQSLDGQMCWDQPKGTISFSNPGLRSVWAGIKSMQEKLGDRVLLVRYEDLLSDPEEVRGRIARFSGFPMNKPFSDFHLSDIPEELSIQMNGVSEVRKTDRPAWMKPERLERVIRSYEAFPDLDDFCQELGYPSLQQMLDLHSPTVPDVEPAESGTICAFHTDDALYTEEANRFQGRLRELGMKNDIKTVTSNGEWVANCAMKATVLIDFRKKLSGPILYSDVDAYFHSDPWKYLGLYKDCDLAAFVNGNGTLISASILVNDTQGARLALKLWKEAQEAAPTEWDQDVLRSVILAEEAKPIEQQRFRFHRLPVSMCKIFDKQHDVSGSPFIEQLQVSREGKWSEDSSGVVGRRKRISELFQV